MAVSNVPEIWKDRLPLLSPAAHKYDRGVAVIYAAPRMTGATRLAAEACARMGAGLVRVVAPEGTGDIYRTVLPAHIIVDNIEDFAGLTDPRIKSVLIGPGCPPQDHLRIWALAAMAQSHINGLVLDAGGLTAWAHCLSGLAEAARPPGLVVTPHEGEFQACLAPFGAGQKILSQDSKEARAVKAADFLNGTVVLKGAGTVIAQPGERPVVNQAHAPQLATAGTGDVLAGMIAGLIAQGMACGWAAAAAVWIHAEAARRFGAGLVAGDLPGLLPGILTDLRENRL